MKNQLSFITLSAALLASSLAGATAPSNGTTVAIDSACSFQALSWSLGATESNGVNAVTVSVTKHVDNCTPILYSLLNAATHVKSVTFTAAGVSQPGLRLTNAVLTADQITGNSTTGLPTEALTFSFQSLATSDAAPSSVGTTNISVNIPSLCSFAATSWSIGASAPPPSTSGSSNGKATASTMSITKPYDSCSVAILTGMNTGKSETTLILSQVDPTSGFTVQFTFEQVAITAYTVNESAASGPATETITVKYSAMLIKSN